ncbi:MAG: hypothetical protein R8K20_07230 [Gallionellaceae bacterium]
MQIKSLSQCATAATAKMMVEKTSRGYELRAHFKGDNHPIRCTTQRGADRAWKSLDVLIKHLNEARFVGVIEYTMTHQIDLV